MTPGDVCRAEAERLDQLGLGDAGDLTLVETRVERTDASIRIVHLFEYGSHKARLLTEPFEGYGSETAWLLWSDPSYAGTYSSPGSSMFSTRRCAGSTLGAAAIRPIS